jgi:cyclophilin family peptidyl-prolyl cis-trans isomerase
MAVKQVITVKTNRGTFKFGLYESDMPKTCTHFTALAKQGFYKGLKFHRVEEWVVQTGDPKGKKTTITVSNLPLEIKEGLGFERPYMVGMARGDDPNSANSQWFVTKCSDPGLQMRGPYACFGEVFEGQKVIDNLKLGDVIEDLQVNTATEKDLALLKKQQSTRSSPIAPPMPPAPQPVEKTAPAQPAGQGNTKTQ